MKHLNPKDRGIEEEHRGIVSLFLQQTEAIREGLRKQLPMPLEFYDITFGKSYVSGDLVLFDYTARPTAAVIAFAEGLGIRPSPEASDSPDHTAPGTSDSTSHPGS